MGRVRDESELFALQIGARSPALRAEDRPPIDVTLVLDTSGSMEGQPLALLQASARRSPTTCGIRSPSISPTAPYTEPSRMPVMLYPICSLSTP